MKKLLLFAIVILFTLGFASNASAQLVTEANTAKGEIITPITIDQKAFLQFGKIAANTAGNVVLTPASTPSVTPSVSTISLVAGTSRTAGKYEVHGAAGFSYTIGLPSDINPVTISQTGGGSGTMTITNFTSLSDNTAGLNQGTLVGGVDIFYVGGQLNLVENQPVGTYQGDFNVTVIYN